jgi:transmembrane sensor
MYMHQDPLFSTRRVAYLIAGFMSNHLTMEERAELDEWIADSDDNMRLFGKLTDQNNILEANEWFAAIEQQEAVNKFTSTLKGQKSFIRKLHPAWIAAASVVIIVIAVSLFKWKTDDRKVTQYAVENKSTNIIQPGAKKAILSDEQGRTFDLSAPKITSIAIDDKSQAVNNHSVLLYNTGSSSEHLHTLTTPRGGEYELILPDGSHVWLNAESSLIYPTAFLSADRTVQLTGEAYFEIHPDPEKPFHVVVNAQTNIRVLGTHFNVNGYANESEKISLLEGKIEVSRKNDVMKMVPGQQLQIMQDHLDMANVEDVQTSVAWVHGKFSFNKTPVDEVLRQVARWYDVNIDNKGTHHDFTGEIFRNSSLVQVLRMLELSTGEHFIIEGRTIRIRP